MELHHLEAFSAVMSAGSMTGAGRLVGRSQPGVTRMIQELEQEIGYALFDRKGPRVTPTQRAFLLYEEVERSLIGLDAIRASARAIGLDAPAPLRVAATPALAAALVPRTIAALAQHEAPLDVQLRSASAEHIVQALLARTVEVGVATLPLDHATLDLHYIVEAPCVAVLHADHPLAGPGVLALQDIAAHPVVTVANRYRLRRRIDAAFADAGLQPVIALETNASLNAVMAAHARLGVALVDPATAFGTRIAGTVVRRIDAHIPFLFGVVTLPGKPLSSGASRLIEALGHVCVDLLPDAVRHAAAQHDALMTRRANPSRTHTKGVPA
ncbi:bacterial regulatory helix-turn-helix, lysR family protein [Paraburkholderia xenovorans LB400]|uniref:Transcriptional regulator, LysR family n=1 Tax=Paraburkholderia xenovorans (strain LB400) TaxID=266265 RepID=Q13IR9_PARXL|nr:LysR family transcriptional regulator [Paraburkholderia xenovorans]ABE36020.1 transcriptional regulator, LysR family [Paraburkholderia xenovorans LB400]AIP35031.1 bacterial regulatory helix-turn-helix, lysR family protein [Paraburkholderia xenovorans LB400]